MSKCKLWKGALSSYGYGCLERDGKSLLAHRVAWDESNGRKVPDGMLVMHSCDRPRCVNPEHLKLGTHADNQADKVAKGRQAKGEKNGRAVLRRGDVVDILERDRRGQAMGPIAREYGVDRMTVRKIIRGVTWKEVSLAWRNPGEKSEGPPVAADEPSVKLLETACECGDLNSDRLAPTRS